MTPAEFAARLQGWSKSGDGFIACCPAHQDSNPSLSISAGDDGRILIKCHAGCRTEDIVKAMGLELKDLFIDVSPTPRPGLTVKELASAKRIPGEFLRSLGVGDQTYQDAPAVRIPYLNQGGEILAVRFRLAMSGSDRFRWRSGDRVQLYGLARLEEVRKAGWVLLVEGESDCWTLWNLGLPALGIPGKDCWREAWRAHVSGLEVYLWLEPDAEVLALSVAKDMPGLKVIQAPPGAKDPSELHLQGRDLRRVLEELKAKAVTVESLRSEERAKELDELAEKARPVLQAQDPLELVRDAVKGLGYGGDLRYPLLTYLAATSRLLQMRMGAIPVHLCLLGPASTGKSYTLNLVLKLLPPEAYHTIDAGSPRVLIYDTADLEHRIVVFTEADSLPAGEDNPAASAVRNLLQDHRLHYKVTVRDPVSGDFTVREVEKPGPSTLITTSIRRLGYQMDTRLFTLEVADDHQHVCEALRVQADLELNGSSTPDEALIAFQGYLQAMAPFDVVVPFIKLLSEMIGKSISAPRILRDFQRLVSLIKAVTVLRHRHRQRDANGRLVADITDYQAIYDLMGDMYEASNTGASKKIREVVSAVAALRAESIETVMVARVAERLGIHKVNCLRRVKEAIKGGWLINEEDKKGRPAKLVLGDDLPDFAGLPPPDSLNGYTVTPQTDGNEGVGPPTTREPGEEG